MPAVADPQDHRRGRRRGRARRRRAEALADGHRVVIAVVDPWGELVAFRRTPDAQVASSRVALDKARTAAIFVRPSREIEEQVTNGRLGALALHGASALTGGIPLKVDSETVGAIGTSGETPDEDESVSIAGAAADFSVAEVPALTQEGAKQAVEAIGAEATRRGVAPVVSAVDAGGALDLPAPSRRCPGRERRRDHRQGPDRRDLPAAEQGLRGPGLRRSALGAPPGARRAAARRRADRRTTAT